jgi:hypothetical protein
MLDNWWLASNNNAAVLMKEFFHVNKSVPDFSFKAKPLAHWSWNVTDPKILNETMKNRNK